MPTAPVPRVLVSGMPIATIAAPYAVVGCAFVPPAGNGPCVTAQWVVGSVAGGVPGPARGHPDGRVRLRADGDAAGPGLFAGRVIAT